MIRHLAIGTLILGSAVVAPVAPVKEEWVYSYDATQFSTPTGEMVDGAFYALEDGSGYVAHIDGTEQFSKTKFKGLTEVAIVGYEPRATFVKRDGSKETIPISRKEFTELKDKNVRPEKFEVVSLVDLTTPRADAAVSFDATSGTRTGPTLNLVYAHTNNGSIVITGGTTINDTVSSISYNGVAGTFVAKSTYLGAGRTGVAVYYNTSPATGSNNVSIVSGVSVFIGGATNSYGGAGAVEASATNAVLAVTSITCTVSTVTANAWRAVFATNSNGNFTAGAGTTMRQVDPNFGSADSNAPIVTPASGSLILNYTGSGSAGCVVVSVPEAAAATVDAQYFIMFE